MSTGVHTNWAPPVDETEQSQDRPKRQSIARISVPSFSSFREQASSIPSSVRRKPVPHKPSPRAVSLDHTPSSSAQPHDDVFLAARPFSVDVSSPLPQRSTGLVDVSEDVWEDARYQASTFQTPSYQQLPRVAQAVPVASQPVQRQRRDTSESSGAPVPLSYDKGTVPCHSFSPRASVSSTTIGPAVSDRRPSSTMSAQMNAPVMTVQVDGIPRTFTNASSESFVSSSSPRRSKTPSGKLTSLFGWKSFPNPESHSPATTFSDVSGSPLHSRDASRFDATPINMGLTPPAVDVAGANDGDRQSQFFPGAPFLSHSPSVNAHVEELERELKQVSSELAGSIRREMELEDEVERFRIEMPSATHELTRRTSDYFSDSGTSSLRYPIGDTEAKIEELERMKRKAEQEKAQMQVDYAQKLADEMRQRKNLEARVHELEEKLHREEAAVEGEVDPADDAEKDDRVRELELFLDEARRRLSQERESKDNFEDLFAALRDEMEKYRNERDNLRDEVVPQLRARVEGLEAEAAETQSLQYENARMQQELQTLRLEIQMLQEAQDSAAQEVNDDFTAPRWPRTGLSRSNSLARSSSLSNLKRSASLARSGSVKERSERPRSDSTSGDRAKDVEDQRDALHKALKNLLCRHENEKREHAKALRKITADRDRARKAVPGRTPFTREVDLVRREIGQLRRRADDAIEQKWQCESNIGGVKMALDRAQQETQSLREYLNGRTAGGSPRKSTFQGLGIDIADESVELGEEDRKTMIKVLRQSIALAETERDAALREAEAYRQRAQMLQDSEEEALDSEQELAEQLLQAAARMETLASQVQEHLQANLELRERLSQAVGKGEAQQSESTARIVGMQSRLKQMEDYVVAAQQMSESALVNHEEEAKQIDEANSPKLQRLTVTSVPSHQTSPLFGIKSPKIGSTSSGKAENLYEASKTVTLERRVKELEAALTDADTEMQEVVRRINSSQYEIAELQGERDEAQRQMRRLQAQISEEKAKAQALLMA